MARGKNTKNPSGRRASRRRLPTPAAAEDEEMRSDHDHDGEQVRVPTQPQKGAGEGAAAEEEIVIVVDDSPQKTGVHSPDPPSLPPRDRPGARTIGDAMRVNLEFCSQTSTADLIHAVLTQDIGLCYIPDHYVHRLAERRRREVAGVALEVGQELGFRGACRFHYEPGTFRRVHAFIHVPDPLLEKEFLPLVDLEAGSARPEGSMW